ncbi:hypothetical protein ACGFOM_28540 [Streptomyces sp. NPDC048594]|uniref:hypothetical protein n=1 Tax=Streptomyces sp. NPDC048594 TaxID=3365575 RepID=UPI00371AD0FE
MLTSRAFGGQTKLLTALRHDARVVEQLAELQARSSITGVQSRTGSEDDEGVDDRSTLSLPAREMLKFSTPRVLNPEHQPWRRGIEAAGSYPLPLPCSRMRLHGSGRG